MSSHYGTKTAAFINNGVIKKCYLLIHTLDRVNSYQFFKRDNTIVWQISHRMIKKAHLTILEDELNDAQVDPNTEQQKRSLIYQNVVTEMHQTTFLIIHLSESSIYTTPIVLSYRINDICVDQKAGGSCRQVHFSVHTHMESDSAESYDDPDDRNTEEDAEKRLTTILVWKHPQRVRTKKMLHMRFGSRILSIFMIFSSIITRSGHVLVVVGVQSLTTRTHLLQLHYLRFSILRVTQVLCSDTLLSRWIIYQ